MDERFYNEKAGIPEANTITPEMAKSDVVPGPKWAREGSSSLYGQMGSLRHPAGIAAQQLEKEAVHTMEE